MTGYQHTDGTGGSPRKLTYADFRRFPNDGQRHELINGEHAVTASPNIRHQELSVRLVVALANFLEPNPVAVVFHAPLDCVFSFFDVVEPDVLVVTNDQREILTKRNVRGAPALVIEILSPDSSPRDKRSKRALYERAGVREYWVVDPASDCISVPARKAWAVPLSTDADRRGRSPDHAAASRLLARPGEVLPLGHRFAPI